MLVLRLRSFEETKQEIHFFQGLYHLEHAGPSGYDRNTLEAFLGLGGGGGEGGQKYYMFYNIYVLMFMWYILCAILLVSFMRS